MEIVQIVFRFFQYLHTEGRWIFSQVDWVNYFAITVLSVYIVMVVYGSLSAVDKKDHLYFCSMSVCDCEQSVTKAVA